MKTLLQILLAIVESNSASVCPEPLGLSLVFLNIALTPVRACQCDEYVANPCLCIGRVGLDDQAIFQLEFDFVGRPIAVVAHAQVHVLKTTVEVVHAQRALLLNDALSSIEI